jgi:uncharacterized protein
MGRSEPTQAAPLTEEDYARLADWLAVHSTFDLQGLLGVLHAVAVAPSVVPPSVWLAAVLPDALDEAAEARAILALMLRLHGEVHAAANDDESMLPDPHDAEACTSFAGGYAAGAALDSDWIGDEARWRLAAPFAYVGNRSDLIPHEMLVRLERSGGLEARQTFRHSFETLFHSARDAFAEDRRAALARLTSETGRGTARVGRNEPCPCGSGKKYKRCCLA